MNSQNQNDLSLEILNYLNRLVVISQCTKLFINFVGESKMVKTNISS